MAFPRVFSLAFKNDRLVGAGHVEQVSGIDASFCLVGDESLRDAVRALPDGPRTADVEHLLQRGGKGWHALSVKGRAAAWTHGRDSARLELGGDNVLVCVGRDSVPDWLRELKQACEPKLLLRVLAAAGLKQELQGTPSEIHGTPARGSRNAAGDGPSAAPPAGKREARRLELTPVFTLLNTALLAVLLLVTLWPLWRAPKPTHGSSAGAAAAKEDARADAAGGSGGAQDRAHTGLGLCDVLPDKAEAARAFCLRVEQAPPRDAAYEAEREQVVKALGAAQQRVTLKPAAREAWGHVVAALHARLLLARYVEDALPADQRRLDAAKPYEAKLKSLSVAPWAAALDATLASGADWKALWNGANPPAPDKLRAELVTPQTIKALPDLLKAAEAASR